MACRQIWPVVCFSFKEMLLDHTMPMCLYSVVAALVLEQQN